MGRQFDDENETVLTRSIAHMWYLRVYHWQLRAMDICYLLHLAWMPQCL